MGVRKFYKKERTMFKDYLFLAFTLLSNLK